MMVKVGEDDSLSGSRSRASAATRALSHCSWRAVPPPAVRGELLLERTQETPSRRDPDSPSTHGLNVLLLPDSGSLTGITGVIRRWQWRRAGHPKGQQGGSSWSWPRYYAKRRASASTALPLRCGWRPGLAGRSPAESPDQAVVGAPEQGARLNSGGWGPGSSEQLEQSPSPLPKGHEAPHGSTFCAVLSSYTPLSSCAGHAGRLARRDDHPPDHRLDFRRGPHRAVPDRVENQGDEAA